MPVPDRAHRDPVRSWEQICVVVVDDQRTFAEALADRLAFERDIEVLAAVGRVDELTAAVPSTVDVVLLGLSGDVEDVRRTLPTLLTRLTAAYPAARLVVLTAFDDRRLVATAIAGGVSGWVGRDVSIGRLLAAVRGVCRDETWIPADLLTGVLQTLTAAPQEIRDGESVLGRLTPREHQVLQCIVDGLSRQQIAEELYLSPNTVRTHVQHVLSKLGVHSVLTAAAVARVHGLDSRAPAPATVSSAGAGWAPHRSGAGRSAS